MKRMDVKRTRNGASLWPRFRASIYKLSRSTAVSAALLSSTFMAGGCTRQQYRCKTDTEAYYLLDEKVQQSQEDNTAKYRIELDSRSRMFNPFNPDRPPMPEDDPQSNRFMRCVDGKKGYPLWEANGRTNAAENPGWWNYLPLDERGVLVLDLNEAVRMGLLHSSTYQQSLETMYLTALDVSSERFRLDSQFFGGWQGSYTSDGPRRGDPTTPNSSSIFTNGPFSGGRRPLSMRKQFATGADLIVGFANSLTWQLAGPNNQSASSVLDFSLVQPLLRQGGRDVVLERLTLAERTLLANVRAFERYRRGFYLGIATGRNPAAAPSRRGGAFGGAGLGGFDVLGSVFSAAGSGFGAGGVGAPRAQGYLGILQSQLTIANQKETIARTQDLYVQYQDTYNELLLKMPDVQTEIPQEQLQVASARQSVYAAQTLLLTLQATYESTLDGFKEDMGLPPYLCVEIKDSLLDQFKLISQSLRDRRSEIATFRTAVGDHNSAMLELSQRQPSEETGVEVRVLAASQPLASELDKLQRRMGPLEQILNSVLNEDVQAVKADIESLRKAVPTRLQQLAKLRDVVERDRTMVCSLLPLGDFGTDFLSGEGLEALPDTLTTELDRIVDLIEEQVQAFDKVAESIESISNDLDGFDSDQERFSEVSNSIVLGTQDLVAGLNESVLAIQLVQARARTESALLPEIDIEPRDAVEIARQNRRDWLNARANLVNSWRAVEVVADDLESVLDLTFSGDVQNVGDNPLALRSSTGRLRVGLQWDSPLTRLQERNNYRQALIQYQQAKRQFYRFEDSIWTAMRTTLRTAQVNKISFEIQRFAVQNAALQVSVNEDIRQIRETLGQSSGATAAQQALQGVQAFNGSQDRLIGVFVTYEALRRGLDLDLGTMEVDSEGLWIDPGPIRADTLGGALSDAILEYGLDDGEMLLRDQIRVLDDQPVEVAPSDQLPSIGPPAAQAPVISVPPPTVSQNTLNPGQFPTMIKTRVVPASGLIQSPPAFSPLNGFDLPSVQ